MFHSTYSSVDNNPSGRCQPARTKKEGRNAVGGCSPVKSLSNLIFLHFTSKEQVMIIISAVRTEQWPEVWIAVLVVLAVLAAIAILH